MKPIGLTFKKVRTNPYSGRTCGELAVVHLCLSCGKISYNRIAGDDNPYNIISIMDCSVNLNRKVINKLTYHNVSLLTQRDKEEVLVALYGYSIPKY